MGFEAAGVVKPLDYDFNPYVDDKGTIPEPTDVAISKYMKGLQAVMKEITGKVDIAGLEDAANDPGKFLAAIESVDADLVMKQLGKMSRLYADLCSGTPSMESLDALPRRVRLKFFQWLSQEVMSPEAETGAGNAQVLNLPSAATG